MPSPLLDVRDLSVDYPVRSGLRSRTHRVVDGVSLHLAPGETLGLVGESGSGKSTIGNAILGLVRPAAGRIVFDGRDITRLSPPGRRRLADQIQVVFQDPYSSLNPSRTIGQTLADPLRARGSARAETTGRVAAVLRSVGLEAGAAHRYPSQFSGGQRQRIAIARAIVLRPRLVICDEPTSSLDLSVQAQVLNLMLELQRRDGLAYLFISHDIAVVHHVAHRVAVLERGLLVEEGPTGRVIDDPAHAYTRALIDATPVPDPAEQAVRRQRRLAHAGR